ncbi:MAG: hypothetical protein LRY27_00930, partial [Chitinophagales bacterium]|nr:hypothetical protein [Chitinophagales bacterium]
MMFKPDKYHFLASFLSQESKNKGIPFLSNHPNDAFEIVEYIYPTSACEQFLKNEITANPEQLIRSFSNYAGANYASYILEQAIIQNPIAAKTYFASNNPVRYTILQNHSVYDSTLMEIYNQTGLSSKSYVLIDPIFYRQLSPQQADELAKEGGKKYFDQLINISKKQNPLGKKALDDELTQIALQKIRPINSQFEEHESAKRFAPLKQYTPEELYTLLVYSQEEIFTSTFSGAYPILKSKLKQDSISSYQLIENMGFNEFRTF